MDSITIAETRTERLDARHIAEDARRHPERTYRQHVEAAQEIAAAEYQAETRRAMWEGRA